MEDYVYLYKKIEIIFHKNTYFPSYMFIYIKKLKLSFNFIINFIGQDMKIFYTSYFDFINAFKKKTLFCRNLDPIREKMLMPRLQFKCFP